MLLLVKTKFILNIILVLTTIALFSCKSSYTFLTIETPFPAQEELPESIQSITLMNRSMNDQFENYQKDSLQIYFFKKGYQLTKIILDSTASDTTVRSLAELMFSSGRYDIVVPVERNIKRDFSYDLLPDTLDPDQVSKICADYQTDALLVLERFWTKVIADYSSERYLDATVGYNQLYFASLDVKYDAFFRIYKPGTPMWVKEISLSDTMNWEGSDYTQAILFRKMPSTKQALIEAGIKVALDIDEKLSPTWSPEKRGYFLITQKNDRGQQLMNENKQTEAADYWAEMAKSKDKKIRSKAEYNLALISELNGDIDQAISWGLKSFYSYYRNQTEVYLKKLKAKKETP